MMGQPWQTLACQSIGGCKCVLCGIGHSKDGTVSLELGAQEGEGASGEGRRDLLEKD